MNQPIEYLGASQSAFKLAHDFNQKLGRKSQITQVAWAFYLDRESKTRESVELKLATSSTLNEDLVPIRFSVGQSAFAGHTLATPIPAFADALKSALKTYLKVLESSRSNDDSFILTESQVEIAFVLDSLNQLEFTTLPQDTKNNVIQKITFTTRYG